MNPIGRPPVPLPILILGKAAVFGCALFFPVRILDISPMLYDSPSTTAFGMILYAVGLVLLCVAMVSLGRSLSVGLPDEQTELKTGGVYRLSRNPIYVAAYLICIGSCFISIHPLNILLLVITVAVHHRIILKEEEFLEQRFGERWLEYKRHVFRYAGRVGG